MRNIFQNSMELREMELIENQLPLSISFTSLISSESFKSSQTIYNSYDNYHNDVMIMEAVTLSTAVPQKPKNTNAFAKTRKTSSGKRDLSILTTAAVEIAHNLNASAIITFSGEPLKTPSSIPFLVFTPRISTMINELTRYIEENNNNIYDKVETRARSAANDIGDAAVIAYLNNLLESGGLVVGIIRMNDSDAIVLYDLSTNRTMKKLKECTDRVDARVLRSVLNVALEIASQGREGKSYGTAFIIGDSNEVLRRSHPLVLNPFEGQPKDSCSIIKPDCWETVKSFAQIDGIFVITGKGIIRAAGRYLDIDAKELSVQKGLGGRHTSAAAITRDTETIAVTVSSSGGTIRIFKDGLELLKIEPDIMLVQ
jgi:diadenylate cyclase